MEVSYKEQLMDDIIKQGELGFSKDEIVANLRAKGVPDSEIKEMAALIVRQSAAQPVETGRKSTGAFVVTILVSLFFIIRGIAAFGQGRQGLGAIFLLCGIIGLIAKLAGRFSS